MAGFIGGTPVSLAGTTWTAIVAAPASGKQREVLGVYVENLDTVGHTFKLRKNVGGTGYPIYPEVVVATLLRAQLLSAPIVLDATNMSLEISDDATASTTEPRADVSVFEVP